MVKVGVHSVLILSLFLIGIAIECLSLGPSVIFTSYGASATYTNSVMESTQALPTPDIQSYGNFGQSVATSPGNIMVVGAGNETVNGYIGAGHVYTFITNVRTLHSTLTSPNTQTDGDFGQSVAISPACVGEPCQPAPMHSYCVYNACTIIVGAPNETVNGKIGAGRAYIFNSNTSALVETFSSPNVQYEGEFGWSVTASGSIVAVGAPNETVNGKIGAGRAYVFNAITGNLISTLTSTEPQTNGHFGKSVGMSDNNVYNTTTLVIGAPGQNVDEQKKAGLAYLFNATTGNLITILKSPNSQSDGSFGSSISLTLNIVAVGAPKEASNGLEFAGNVYLFKIGKSAKLLYTLVDPNPQAKGYFGWSVWLSEQTVGVGAPGETVNGFVRAGYAYTFNDENGSLISTYVSSNAWTDGTFGSSITLVQGPHFPGYIIAIGAPNENVSGDIASGNVYVQLNSTS